MANKLKIGVFGGARGYVMIDQLLHSEDAVLVAVCDKYRPILEKVDAAAKAAGLTVALYETFDEFLQHDMDAVVLANYATEHAPYAVRCLRAGKHVMSELLPCETLAQAVELCEAVEQSGCVYTYAENCCYMQAPFEMWLRYKKGEIGEAVYGEGEYIHDLVSGIPALTYGERNHWRNRMYSTFYCTHSTGPLMTITGLRPVSVVGFEGPVNDNPAEKELGYEASIGIEMITMENGAIFKSMHGPLKRFPHSHNYQIFGKSGCMESDRMNEQHLHSIVEGPKPGDGSWQHYDPDPEVSHEAYIASGVTSHGGCDFYPLHFFIQKILGKPDGEWAIGLYQALDMFFCGLFAYRSILAGNRPMTIPDFRDPAQREGYRNDTACVTPEVAGNQLLPHSAHPCEPIPDSVFEHVRQLWLEQAQEYIK